MKKKNHIWKITPLPFWFSTCTYPLPPSIKNWYDYPLPPWVKNHPYPWTPPPGVWKFFENSSPPLISTLGHVCVMIFPYPNFWPDHFHFSIPFFGLITSIFLTQFLAQSPPFFTFFWRVGMITYLYTYPNKLLFLWKQCSYFYLLTNIF